MKKNKILCLALCSILAVCVLFGKPVVTKAYTADELVYDKNRCVEWEVKDVDSENKAFIDGVSTLNSGSVTLVYHDLDMKNHVGIERSYYNYYSYANSIEVPFEYGNGIYNETYSIYSAGPYSEIITYNDGTEGYFATEAGQAKMTEFLNGGGIYMGNSSDYRRLYSQFDQNAITSFVDGYSKDNATNVFDVYDLSDKLYYDLVRVDESGIYKKIEFKIFSIEGDLYCVKLDDLDNSYFDASGNFSYRKGQINLYKFTQEERELFDNQLFEPGNIYGENAILDDILFDNAITGFLIFCTVIVIAIYVVLGIIIPLTALIISSVKLAHKRGKKYRWITIISISSALILFTVIVFILMAIRF